MLPVSCAGCRGDVWLVWLGRVAHALWGWVAKTPAGIAGDPKGSWGERRAWLRGLLLLFWCEVWGGPRAGSLGTGERGHGVGDAAGPDPGICSPLALMGPRWLRGPQGRWRWPRAAGFALAGWAQSRDQRPHLLLLPSCAAPGLIWHLPEEQPEALGLLSGLTSCTGVLRPCGGCSHWKPAAGVHRSPLLGGLGTRSAAEPRRGSAAPRGHRRPTAEGALPSLL